MEDFRLDPQVKTFPIVKGSMISSPVLQSFDNHLTSRQINSESEGNRTLLRRMIRLSSNILS